MKIFDARDGHNCVGTIIHVSYVRVGNHFICRLVGTGNTRRVKYVVDGQRSLAMAGDQIGSLLGLALDCGNKAKTKITAIIKLFGGATG